jgi:hypothetical protein
MKYTSVNKDDPRAMWLQSIGAVLGTPFSEVEEGDFLMWNWGAVYEVGKTLKETQKTKVIETWDVEKPEKKYQQRLFKSRLVCKLQK